MALAERRPAEGVAIARPPPLSMLQPPSVPSVPLIALRSGGANLLDLSPERQRGGSQPHGGWASVRPSPTPSPSRLPAGGAMIDGSGFGRTR